MKISQSSWNRYIEKLSAINAKAGKLMQKWMLEHPNADTADMINYAYAVASRYGEASASLACEMYDATATAQGARVPAAEPARTATYTETGIAVNGAKLRGDAIVPQAVERLVKMAGQDTLLNNSLRDDAEWAWIPMGETCAFCITLASRGWQKASRKAIKGGHAEHIHSHCDCSYAIRFDGKSTIDGYDPDEYLKQYRDAGGDINAMRRENYARNKDRINAQKREAYAKRNGTLVKTNNSPPTNVLGQVIKFDERLAPNVKQIIEKLAREYDTRLYEVKIGADKAAGTVDVGGTMRLSAKKSEVPIHEFAHSIATYDMQKFGLTDYDEFWKEIKKLQRRYRKEVGDDSSRWISAYENSKRNVDEFLAEGFTHAKMHEWGMEIPERYGNLEVSKEVLKIVDKYFKKKR